MASIILQEAMAEREKKQQQQQQPHAVVVPYPGQGHINPLMQLSLRLATDHGFYVTFACTRGNLDSILRSWAKSGLLPPLQRGISIHLHPVRDDVLPPRSMNAIFQFMVGCQNLKQPLLEVIDEINKDDSVPPISCVVSDSMLYAVQGVAETLGVPWIAYYPLSALTLLAHLTEAEGKAAEVHPTLGKELPVLLNPGAVNTNLRQNFVVSAVNYLKRAEWVILNTSDALESAELEAVRQRGYSRVLPVGPLQPVEYIYDNNQMTFRIPTATMWYEEEDLVLSWLNSRAKSSVLYISFGSIASVRLKDLKKLFDALVETKQWFLWVFRMETVDGEESMKQQFVDRAKQFSHGIIVSWVPQLKVLRHPATGAFLSHCGWNSTFEAIVAGVPVIAWPCFADQGVNARQLVDNWKIGVDISPEGNMVGVVKEVMTGDLGSEMRRRAASLSVKCRGDSYVQSQNNLKKIFEQELI